MLWIFLNFSMIKVYSLLIQVCLNLGGLERGVVVSYGSREADQTMCLLSFQFAITAR